MQLEKLTAENLNDDGAFNLMSALLIQAREDYELSFECFDPLSARMKADYDARGIVGIILDYVVGDNWFMYKQIDKRIKEERSKHGIK